MTKKRINTFIGSIGAFIGVLVFLSYIPQIIANIGGEKSQPLQPLVAAISCLLWVIYGLTNEHKIDYILIIPNAAGVIFDFYNSFVIMYILGVRGTPFFLFICSNFITHFQKKCYNISI